MIKMKKHLKNISNILLDFIDEYEFIKYYLHIKGEVKINSFSSLNIECNSEFNKFTIEKVKKIKQNIYEKIRKYLQDNKINKTLYIKTNMSNHWAVSDYTIYFKDELTF